MEREEPTIEQARPTHQLVIAWQPGPGGVLNVSFPPDEVICRFMMDKARAFLDDEWRKRNAPTVLPANGQRVR